MCTHKNRAGQCLILSSSFLCGKNTSWLLWLKVVLIKIIKNILRIIITEKYEYICTHTQDNEYEFLLKET